MLKNKQKAMVLWREFAWQTYFLDIEAIEALLLRDELAVTDLLEDEQVALRAIDRQVVENAATIVEQLEQTGTMALVHSLREHKERPGQWWWWLDLDASSLAVS